MRILIAYDGSEEAHAALHDLRRAGLPEHGEALILSVADTVAQLSGIPLAALASGPWCYVTGTRAERRLQEEDIEHARKMVQQAAVQLRSDLPGWHISTESREGSAKFIIMEESLNWKPDLIVIGAPVRSTFSHLLKASVFKAIWHHAGCSVRIGRCAPTWDNRPIRLVVGVNGSENALMAVKAVAARNWPAGTLAKVIGILETDASAGLLISDRAAAVAPRQQKSFLSLAVRNGAARLQLSHVAAVPQVRVGTPAEALLKEAKEWEADAIFIGANEGSVLEHLFNGKISATVASRAPCSVELCRPTHSRNRIYDRGRGFAEAAEAAALPTAETTRGHPRGPQP